MNILNIKTPLQKWNTFFLALSCFLKNLGQDEPSSEQANQDWLTSNLFFNIFNVGVLVDHVARLR